MMQLAEHEAAAVHAVPLPQHDWCLFLDVDGTLLELADSPGGVAVDAALQPLLTRLRSVSASHSGRGKLPMLVVVSGPSCMNDPPR